MNDFSSLEALIEESEQKDVALESLPSMSIIVPTFNCSQSLPLTLESILEQNYGHYEIIAIDAGSTDRTLELIQSYESPLIRMGAVSEFNTYEMINIGIAMAQGEYVNVLFPGDFYIHHHTLLDIAKTALKHQKPQLVYCGSLLRDGRAEVKFLFRRLSLDLLRKGQQPTSLQGCWFRRDVFNQIGLFRTDFQLRGGFDLLCRFCLSHLTFASFHRALTDYDLRWVTSAMVVRHFWETLQILYRYFGLWTTLRWMRRQKDLKRFAKLWLKRLRVAFLGK